MTENVWLGRPVSKEEMDELLANSPHGLIWATETETDEGEPALAVMEIQKPMINREGK